MQREGTLRYGSLFSGRQQLSVTGTEELTAGICFCRQALA